MKKNIIKGVVSALALAVIVGFAPVNTATVEAASKPKISSFTESNVNAYNKIKITFKAKKTKSYKVQISTKKSSGYKKVSYKKSDSGSKETFTIKKVGTSKIAANKTYYVKVTVYAKANYKGSKVTKTYKVYSAPTKVSAIKVTNTDTAKQTIKWSKVKGASGYYVTYNGVTKKTTKASLSVSLKNGSYTAKVVPYSVKKVNGKNVTLKSSGFSKKFTVRVASTTTNNTNSSENTFSNNSGSSSSGGNTDTSIASWHNTLLTAESWNNVYEGNSVFVYPLGSGAGGGYWGLDDFPEAYLNGIWKDSSYNATAHHTIWVGGDVVDLLENKECYKLDYEERNVLIPNGGWFWINELEQEMDYLNYWKTCGSAKGGGYIDWDSECEVWNNTLVTEETWSNLYY